ncbi:jg21155 [Pararge aegeria aegeria]|uniref:Jg21155 protein n=1 Tax=Pararge aegeria aegeria TaxID=348720 RepID=A0A8S4SPN1_9NEOP|nr:jg21155 [Pararge aegeria aegeria]
MRLARVVGSTGDSPRRGGGGTGANATLPLCASCERKTERLPYYLRAALPYRPAYVDYEDTAFTFDHPALKRSSISRISHDIINFITFYSNPRLI